MIELKTVQNKIQGAIKDADRIASDNRTALGSASRNYITKCAGGLAAIAILVTVLTFSYSLFKKKKKYVIRLIYPDDTS